jgi:hypothetical protein
VKPIAGMKGEAEMCLEEMGAMEHRQSAEHVAGGESSTWHRLPLPRAHSAYGDLLAVFDVAPPRIGFL